MEKPLRERNSLPRTLHTLLVSCLKSYIFLTPLIDFCRLPLSLHSLFPSLSPATFWHRPFIVCFTETLNLLVIVNQGFRLHLARPHGAHTRSCDVGSNNPSAPSSTSLDHGTSGELVPLNLDHGISG